MWEATINRRDLIRNSLVLASCAVIPISINHKPNTDALERLIAAISHQCAINDTLLTEEDIQAMTYAFNKIKPQNHVEYAVVTACASRYLYNTGLIDEYVRRKNGNTPELFYHPVFDLEKRCLPNTYGILFFRDQAICILQELTSTVTTKATAYWSELIKWKLGFDDFVKVVIDKYKKELGAKGLQDTYNFIRTCSPYTPYFWNSNIVSKAGL